MGAAIAIDQLTRSRIALQVIAIARAARRPQQLVIRESLQTRSRRAVGGTLHRLQITDTNFVHFGFHPPRCNYRRDVTADT